MESFLDKLRDTLRSQFPGSREDLERYPPRNRKVGGALIWDGFQDLEPLERQKRVWAALRERLSREDQLRITAIFTFTPAEWSVMTAGTNVKADTGAASEPYQPQGNHPA